MSVIGQTFTGPSLPLFACVVVAAVGCAAPIRTPAPTPPTQHAVVDDGASDDDDLADLGAEFRGLRVVRGHFAGGTWNDDVDGAGGRKGVLLGQLLTRLRPRSRDEIVAVLGEPDASARGGDELWALAAPVVTDATGLTMLVYEWRGRHDFIFFVVDDAGHVVTADWWMAGE